MNINNDILKLANLIRYKTIESSYINQNPHLGSCLSCADILVWLYLKKLKFDFSNYIDRDKFILSKGHAAPLLFQILAYFNFFDNKLLDFYSKDGSFFGEHPPAPHFLKGIEAATGSLGHGLPMALGMAFSNIIQNKSNKVFVLLGDGECNEGSIWEAALFAASKKLNNLYVYVDYNKWQATARSNDVLQLAPLEKKWGSFGWATVEIDGHSFQEIENSFELLKDDERPKVFIANTIKGKGIHFMEDDNNWHYRIPTREEVIECATLLDIDKSFTKIQ